MTRVISGITSSNRPTIGNYIGAIRHWVSVQDEQESFYFIANSHAITVRQDPKQLHDFTLDNFAWLLATGLDPDKNTIFIQSMISAHTELAWILNNYTTVGELNRMTQYKDKAALQGPNGELVGLFDYPVLMAADILLYDAQQVPVGHDQLQHLELTRTVAARFNNIYGPTFVMPKALTAEFGTRIMKLDDPTRKMSKSDPGPGTIYLDEPEDAIVTKIKRAVTDSGNEVRQGADKPAITNLIHIYSAFAEISPSEIEHKYNGRSYGDFKSDLASQIVDKITTLQKSYVEIRNDEAALLEFIKAGNAKARLIAERKLANVKQLIGLL